MGWTCFYISINKCTIKNYLQNANKDNAIKYVFKAIDETNSEVIGHISLGNVDKTNESARIGKVLIGSTNSRGKGYGTQMMTAVLKFAFEELKLHKVTLGVFDFNESAIKCYKKSAFNKKDSYVMLEKVVKNIGI